MTPSIDFNTPVIRIPGYESKYDFAGASNSLVKIFDDYLEARIVQQFHFWLFLKRGGAILGGFKWIYKALIQLMSEAIVGFSEYRVRKAIAALVEKGILIREQLHRQHYGAIHALASYNRQYYYRIDYSVLAQFIQTQIQATNLEITLPWHLQAETIETKGFVNTADQVCEGHEPVLRMSQNTPDTTFKNYHSNTLPPTPLDQKSGLARERTQQSDSLNSPDIHTKRQDSVNSSDVGQNTSNSKPIPLSHVVARPPRVEQKINQQKVVQRLVLSETEANAVVQESAGTDVSPPQPPEIDSAPQEPPNKRHKTKKGTKPHFDSGLAPWSNLEQFKKFYRALIASAYVRRMAKNLEALVNRIVNELRQGVPHPFWDDFIAGREIGSSTRQEWQMPDGSPHPDFIEYLAEKLIKGNNTQTREIAIAEALRIAKDPETARFFWKECKVSLVNAKARTDRDLALGVSSPVTPTWTHERVEPTIEEAAAASMEIKGINQQTTRAIEAASSPQAQLEGDSQPKSIAPKTEQAASSAIVTADPWLEDDKSKRKKSIRETYAELHGGMDKIPKVLRPKKVKSRRADSSSKLDLNNLDIAQINKALADPVLNADLTPQIMRSDYRIITDEFGRITGVEPPI